MSYKTLVQFDDHVGKYLGRRFRRAPIVRRLIGRPPRFKIFVIFQARTFACSFDNRPCGLVFDIKQGISLYDILTKVRELFILLHSAKRAGKLFLLKYHFDCLCNFCSAMPGNTVSKISIRLPTMVKCAFSSNFDRQPITTLK